MACREKTRNARRAPPSLSLSLLHIPYKDRCDWLPTLCLINTVLPSSPSFSHTLSVFHCPGSLAFQAFIGDCSDRDAGKKTRRNSIESLGNEIVDENKTLIFNWKELGMWCWCVFDRFCLQILQSLNVVEKIICEKGRLYLDGGSRGEAGWGDLERRSSEAKGQIWNRQ